MNCLVLDAMGVLFRAADDVAELLIPFIEQRGGSRDHALIEAAYHDASLGHLDADDFWRRVGLAPQLESDFLERHRLNRGAEQLLQHAADLRLPVWCLSNDVGRWSRRLRQRLGLDASLAGATISGDVGLRKPDPEIYRVMLDQSGYRAGDMLFIDDRAKNIAAARDCGIKSHLFEPALGFAKVHEWLAGCRRGEN